jgi:hypothetical protein
MYRLRSIIPLVITSLAPTFGDADASFCSSANWSTPACEEERTHEFEADRNAEINASIAAVAAARAALASNLTYCKSPTSTAPRCEAERAHELALSLTHCDSEG